MNELWIGSKCFLLVLSICMLQWQALICAWKDFVSILNFMCNVLVFYANIKIICWDNTYIDLVTSFTWKNENIILFWCFTFQSGSCERLLSWEEEGKTKKCFVELLQSVSWVLHSSLLVWSLLYLLPRLLALCCVSEALNSMVILHQTIE